MRRTKTVLAVVAVMAAMLVAFAAPALADNDRNEWNDRDHHRWFDNNNRHHDDWFDHRDDEAIFVYDDADFEYDDLDDDDYYPYYWGWGYYPYWGWGGGCEGPVCLID